MTYVVGLAAVARGGVLPAHAVRVAGPGSEAEAMTLLAWFLSDAAFPVALGAGLALAIEVARRPRTVRHYRWRNRRFLRQVRAIELRNRTPGGSGEDAGSVFPRPLPAAGGDVRPPRPVAVALPPAPSRLAGAGVPSPAPAGPPRVTVHG